MDSLWVRNKYVEDRELEQIHKNTRKSEDKIVTTICLYDGQKSLSCHTIWGEFLYFTIANVGNTHASNSEQ